LWGNYGFGFKHITYCNNRHNFLDIEKVGGKRMKELLELIAKALVDNPDEVSVNEVEGEQSIILELKVAKEDMGKVIGKQGKIAKAIRTVIKSAAVKENKRVTVDIIQ
jgi:predicted RNA-binding protein YlqC (UPF0109 family)